MISIEIIDDMFDPEPAIRNSATERLDREFRKRMGGLKDSDLSPVVSTSVRVSEVLAKSFIPDVTSASRARRKVAVGHFENRVDPGTGETHREWVRTGWQ